MIDSYILLVFRKVRGGGVLKTQTHQYHDLNESPEAEEIDAEPNVFLRIACLKYCLKFRDTKFTKPNFADMRKCILEGR